MIWTVTYTNLTYYMIKKNINLLSNTVNKSEQNEKKSVHFWNFDVKQFKISWNNSRS